MSKTAVADIPIEGDVEGEAHEHDPHQEAATDAVRATGVFCGTSFLVTEFPSSSSPNTPSFFCCFLLGYGCIGKCRGGAGAVAEVGTNPGLGLAYVAGEVVVVTKRPLLLSFFSRHDSPLLLLSFCFAHHAGDVDPGDGYHKGFKSSPFVLAMGERVYKLEKNKQKVSLSWLVSALPHLLLGTNSWLPFCLIFFNKLQLRR